MKDSGNETKNIWTGINILIITFGMFGGVFLLGYTSRITSVLFDIGLPVNIVLVLFYRIYKKYRRFRKTVILLRTTAIIIFMLGLLAPVVLLNFKHTKSMYPIKRFCYNYGVYQIENFLPDNMPEKCDDYLFITKGSVPAQDYHADAYLIFHTDKNTLKNYENHFDSMNDAERQTVHMPNQEEKQIPDEYKILLKCPEELPRYVFWELQSEHIHDFEKAIIYTVPSYYGKGCMLDYDSGLAVFWY